MPNYENSRRLNDDELLSYCNDNYKYDSETGILYRIKYANGSKLGEIGFIHNGRLEVNIGYRSYFVHRICYLMHHGYAPNCIDHANRNKMDNSINNLRPATHSQNMMNKEPKPNKHGFIGVSKKTTEVKFIARFQKDGKRLRVGGFNTAKEAAIFRDKMTLEEFGEFATLNFPQK